MDAEILSGSSTVECYGQVRKCWLGLLRRPDGSRRRPADNGGTQQPVISVAGAVWRQHKPASHQGVPDDGGWRMLHYRRLRKFELRNAHMSICSNIQDPQSVLIRD